jgi:SLT domain-containing protein
LWQNEIRGEQVVEQAVNCTNACMHSSSNEGRAVSLSSWPALQQSAHHVRLINSASNSRSPNL